MDYQEYLKSEHWQQTRKAVLEFWGGRCSICKSGFKVEVHHNNYQCLGHEKLSDLACLCELCHDIYKDILPDPNWNKHEFSSLVLR
jgi:hypothetical protein